MINTITAADTLTLFGRVFTGLSNGSVSKITFDKDLADMKTGKNKNTIFSENATGSNAKLELRLMRGCSDDIFLQNQLASQRKDFAFAAR